MNMVMLNFQRDEKKGFRIRPKAAKLFEILNKINRKKEREWEQTGGQTDKVIQREDDQGSLSKIKRYKT